MPETTSASALCADLYSLLLADSGKQLLLDHSLIFVLLHHLLGLEQEEAFIKGIIPVSLMLFLFLETPYFSLQFLFAGLFSTVVWY